MAKVPNGVETLPKISIAWVGCTNVTDRRQTDDRQTDGRRHISNMNMSSRSLKSVTTWMNDVMTSELQNTSMQKNFESHAHATLESRDSARGCSKLLGSGASMPSALARAHNGGLWGRRTQREFRRQMPLVQGQKRSLDRLGRDIGIG